jgi:hypothetical protein
MRKLAVAATLCLSGSSLKRTAAISTILAAAGHGPVVSTSEATKAALAGLKSAESLTSLHHSLTCSMIRFMDSAFFAACPRWQLLKKR